MARASSRTNHFTVGCNLNKNASTVRTVKYNLTWK